MTVEKQQGQQQFVQCFQLSMDNLKGIIKEAVESVIHSLPAINNNTVSSEDDSEAENDLISPKEVCKIIKVSSSTLWRYNTITGILKPKVKIGRKVYYSKKEVSNFLNNNTL